jgi:heme-degrading monooxygenase HmoA
LREAWNERKEHEDFIASSAYGPFLEKFLSITEGGPSIMRHVDFKPDGALATVFSAPVTEFATFYFDDEPPADYVETVANKMGDVLREGAEGYLGHAVGVTHEVVEHEGVKGKAAVLAVGWQSKDAHMAYRETQSFKDNIHLLRSTMKKATMW